MVEPYITTKDLLTIAKLRLDEVDRHNYPSDKLIWLLKAKAIVLNIEKNIRADIASVKKTRGAKTVE